MYGLPEDFDGSFLVGHRLEMICFNSNQLYLHFDGQLTIKIEGEFSYDSGLGDSEAKPIHPPITESKLMHLLEHSISQAAGNEVGTLTIMFDNGHILKCFESFDYESYEIKHGADRLIV